MPKRSFDEADSFAGIVASDEGDGTSGIGEQARDLRSEFIPSIAWP
jgi:hypothetical protein